MKRATMDWNSSLAVALIMVFWLIVMTFGLWGLTKRTIRQMHADTEATKAHIDGRAVGT
jgi:hypothetical protein